MGDSDNEKATGYNKETEMMDMKRLLASMAALLEKQSQNSSTTTSELSIATVNAIEARIQEFNYAPEEGSTFERWWNRYEDIFTIDLKALDDVKKSRLLIRHVSTSVERTFVESIAPTKWIDMTLDQVKEKMLTLFGDNTSLFDRRRAMFDLKMSRDGIEDVRVLAARVNKIVENAQMSSITSDEMKCMVFLHAMDLPRYSDIHLRMLQIAKKKGEEIKLDDLIDVFNEVSQIKRDSRAINTPSMEVNMIYDQAKDANKYGKASYKREDTREMDWKAKSAKKHNGCHRCGQGGHHEHKCYRRSLTCHRCDRKGHIAEECSEDEDEDRERRRREVNTVLVHAVKSADFRIDAKLNGVAIAMDVDTGADITFISDEVWRSIGSPACVSSNCEAVCASGKQLEITGMFIGQLEYGGIGANAEVHVSTTDRNIMGVDLIKKLNLLEWRSTKNEKALVMKEDAKAAVKKETVKEDVAVEHH